MNRIIFGRISGIVMTAAMCGTLAAPAFAQQPTVKGDASRFGQGQSGQSMAQIRQAHSQLQSAVMSTLTQQTKEFFSKSRNDSRTGNDPKSGNDPNSKKPKFGVPTDTSANRGKTDKNVSLDEKELLIAACPHGLLAGAAATGWSSTEHSQNRPGSTRDRAQKATKVTSGTDMASDETAGMILIYSDKARPNTGSFERGSEDASGRLSRGLGDTSTANDKSLKPGVYAVKCNGSSVSLTDESGRTVLRTTTDQQFASKRANRAASRTNVASEQTESDRSKSRESGRDHSGNGGEGQSWEAVFGAVTCEVMASMGWSSNSSVAASGR